MAKSVELRRHKNLRLMSMVPAQVGWRALFVYCDEDNGLQRFETNIICWGHYLKRAHDVYELGDEVWFDDVRPLVNGFFGIDHVQQAEDQEGWGLIALLEPGECDNYADSDDAVQLAIVRLKNTSGYKIGRRVEADTSL